MLAIFKREMRSYFNSVLGFVFVAAFMAITNVYFMINSLMQGSSMLTPTFSIMPIVLMLLMPLLTMRSFSEEYKQKTDQLLLTAPIRPGEIVSGKFMAVMAVFTTAMLHTLIWVLLVSLYGTPFPAEIIGSYLATFCLASVFVSIGIFMSSLTENQIISAVCSIGIFFLLYLLDILVGGLGSSLPGWLYTFLSFFSLYTRSASLSAGMLLFSDIVYYLSMTGLFLFLTVRVLDKKRWG